MAKRRADNIRCPEESEAVVHGGFHQGDCVAQGAAPMTKSELVDAIAARADLTKMRAEEVVNCVFDAMTEALRDGKRVEIRGFGSLTARVHKPYQGRNPRTGNLVNVPPKVRPFFRVGKELKELVDTSREIGGIRESSERRDT